MGAHDGAHADLGQRIRLHAARRRRRSYRALAVAAGPHAPFRMSDGSSSTRPPIRSRRGARSVPGRGDPLPRVRHRRRGNLADRLAPASVGDRDRRRGVRRPILGEQRRPGGVLAADKPINDADYERALRRYRSRHEGLANSSLVALLDNGMKWQDVGIPPGDAQFIETRKFQVREAARAFRVPPYKIADLEAGSVSYASVEVQQLDYIVSSLQSVARPDRSRDQARRVRLERGSRARPLRALPARRADAR
jgi:hypothetical protein